MPPDDDAVPTFRLSAMGSGACLLDAAGAVFDTAVQERVWAVGRAALAIEGVLEAVPGMNNLMLVFDPLRLAAGPLAKRLATIWREVMPQAVDGRLIEIPVVYGGARGEDLPDLASHCGLTEQEVVRRHVGESYIVAAVGAMPGFPYLSGLDPSLARGRRASPRASVLAGAVIIGGAQAGIMPVTAPSGWHIIGHTDRVLFDPAATDPVLLRPGDRLRFTIAGTAA